jgi:hypothetical protein
MDAYELNPGVALSELNQVIRCGLAWLITAGFEPRVLQDRRIHGGRSLHDEIHFRNVARPVSFDLPDADHRAIPHAAIELLHAEFGVRWAHIHGAIGAVGKAPHSPHHSIVFLSKLVRRGVEVGGIPLGKEEPLNS